MSSRIDAPGISSGVFLAPSVQPCLRMQALRRVDKRERAALFGWAARAMSVFRSVSVLAYRPLTDSATVAGQRLLVDDDLVHGRRLVLGRGLVTAGGLCFGVDDHVLHRLARRWCLCVSWRAPCGRWAWGAGAEWTGAVTGGVAGGRRGRGVGVGAGGGCRGDRRW